METAEKIAALAVITATFCVLLRENNKPVSVILSVISCVGIFLLGVQFVKPILEVAKEIQSISGLGTDMIKPLVKIVGIGLLTNIVSTVCADAGESALGKTAEAAGTILAIYASLPLLLMRFLVAVA